MIQIRQTKDDLTAKGLLILLAHTSGLHAAGMLGRVRSIISADRARIIGGRTGDLSTIENWSIGTRVQADEVGRGKERPHSHSAQVLEQPVSLGRSLEVLHHRDHVVFELELHVEQTSPVARSSEVRRPRLRGLLQSEHG
jgi:hypothetical protein